MVSQKRFLGYGAELEQIMNEVLVKMQEEIANLRERIETGDIDIDYQI